MVRIEIILFKENKLGELFFLFYRTFACRLERYSNLLSIIHFPGPGPFFLSKSEWVGAKRSRENGRAGQMGR